MTSTQLDRLARTSCDFDDYTEVVAMCADRAAQELHEMISYLRPLASRARKADAAFDGAFKENPVRLSSLSPSKILKIRSMVAFLESFAEDLDQAREEVESAFDRANEAFDKAEKAKE